MADLLVPGRLPAGVTKEGDGILTGHGPVRVDAFIDFLCPFCQRFELAAGPTLAGPPFAACLADAPYRDWPPYVTARATARGVQATPTVVVAGTAVKPEPSSIASAVVAAGQGGAD